VESVEVESTFDFVYGVKDFISQEIQARLTESFREDIPAALYELSLLQSRSDNDDKNDPQENDYSLEASFISVPSNPPVVGVRELASLYLTLNPSVPGITFSESRATLRSYDHLLPSGPRNLESVSDEKALLSEILTDDLHAAERRQVKPKRRVVNLRDRRVNSETPTLEMDSPLSSSLLSMRASTPTDCSSSPACSAVAADFEVPDFSPAFSHSFDTVLDGTYYTADRLACSKSPSPSVSRSMRAPPNLASTPFEKKSFLLANSAPDKSGALGPPSYFE
jgi:hypothetical protein